MAKTVVNSSLEPFHCHIESTAEPACLKNSPFILSFEVYIEVCIEPYYCAALLFLGLFSITRSQKTDEEGGGFLACKNFFFWLIASARFFF